MAIALLFGGCSLAKTEPTAKANFTSQELPHSLKWNFWDKDNPSNIRQFTAAERDVLVARGFFIEPTEPMDWLRYDDMIDSYRQLIAADDWRLTTVPVFISSDLLLHSFHLMVDRMIQEIEEKRFYPALVSLTRNLLTGAEDQYQTTSGVVQQAARDNLIFLAVAYRLLEPDSTLSGMSPMENEVASELAKIEAAAGFAKPVVFGLEKEDYSQYKPRGHYTKTETLKRFFKAMMWFGRIPFLTSSNRATMSALLLTALMKGENLKLWESIYKPTVYFVGESDDLTIYQYRNLMKEIYGDNRNWSEFANMTKLNSFLAKAKALPPPRIVSIATGTTTKGTERAEKTRGFRLMGQRFIPDSYIFTHLTSPEITGTRNMPTALDIMAILGSEPADTMLAATRKQIAGYAQAFDNLQKEINNLPDSEWTQNIYWSWLYTLRALFVKKQASGYPFFIRTSAWQRKALLAALGSWTELRHDTILYGKQSYAEAGEGESEVKYPPLVKSYLEPDTLFLTRLLNLARTTRQLLNRQQIMPDEYQTKFQEFDSLLAEINAIARRELSDAVTTRDYERILALPDELGGLVLPWESGGDFNPEDLRMALVADVHTDAFGGRVLEEATGVPQKMFVAIKDNSGGVRIAVGYVYSYYEFTMPMAQRMTDQEWQKIVYVDKDLSTLEEREPKWIGELRLR
jgi:hypothetical protein